MKNIVGLVRKMDGLGRVTIPKELRDIFDLNAHEYVEIYATEQGIFIRNPAIEIKRLEREVIGKSKIPVYNSEV
ncbi:MAG: AbrB/MazE/SpoVT family DNA-binding domain-containing protein [Clostridiales bacterium]|nr:AbrB/MazE/SpoVT family DNA-binding domain-containing protein [Clostridiales bacterium]